jgi:hypothetical protein
MEAGHGRISGGWEVDVSVQPWREGRPISDVLGADARLVGGASAQAPQAAAVQWGGVSFDLVEGNRPVDELAWLLASVGA